MTCPRIADTLLLDSEWTREQRQDLEAHARDCAECGAAVASLREARAIARQVTLPPSEASTRARVLGKAARARKQQADRWWAPALAAVALLVVVLLRGPLASLEERAAGPGPEAVGEAQIEVREGQLRTTATGALTLLEGWVEVRVDPRAHRPLTLETDQVRVHATSGHFSVQSSKIATAVRVTSGTAQVTLLADDTRRTLTAGEEALFTAHDASETPSPDNAPSARATSGEPPRMRVPAPARRADRPGAVTSSARDAATIAPDPSPPGSTMRTESVSRADVVEQNRRVQAAQDAVDRDPSRASNLAIELIDTGASPTVEARAIAVLADAYRRQARLAEAAEWYGRLARHPSGRPYVEEALYQRAQLLLELDDAQAALTALEAPMPTSALLPERLALLGRAYEATGDLRSARRAYGEAIEKLTAIGDLRAAEALEERRAALGPAQ